MPSTPLKTKKTQYTNDPQFWIDVQCTIKTLIENEDPMQPLTVAALESHLQCDGRAVKQWHIRRCLTDMDIGNANKRCKREK